MEENTHAPKALRFGPFEADLRAGELRKNGLRLKLREKPFQILALLLERAGEVVTREELQQRLWPEDTFVDFDNSLNTGISKLREALGESASRTEEDIRHSIELTCCGASVLTEQARAMSVPRAHL